jgi:hypothetical protein
MQRQTNREIADQLLMDWYLWTKPYRPALGAPRVSPYCKESQTSNQYDDPSDMERDRVYITQMKSVAFCVDSIPVPMQQAIGIEMKNREVKSRVWSCKGATSYEVALDAVMSKMRRECLIQ